MEVLQNQGLFANGNRKEEVIPMKKEVAQMKKEKSMLEISLVNSPPVAKWLKEEQEFLTREVQFYEMVQHVLEKIEKESSGDVEEEKDLWSGASILDMKQFLKSDVNVTGVSESSSIFILESVSTKVGRLLHSADVYDLCELAACTASQVETIAKKSTKGVLKSDIEFAVQDAKSVMNIVKSEKRTKGNWGANLSRVTDALHLKESTEKLANFVWNMNPKGLVDVIVRSQDNEDDISSFYRM